MTPDRTAALEQAVGKLALLVESLYQMEARRLNVQPPFAITGQGEAAEIAKQFSQPQEVKRDAQGS